jgi:hypothetical protein
METESGKIEWKERNLGAARLMLEKKGSKKYRTIPVTTTTVPYLIQYGYGTGKDKNNVLVQHFFNAHADPDPGFYLNADPNTGHHTKSGFVLHFSLSPY